MSFKHELLLVFYGAFVFYFFYNIYARLNLFFFSLSIISFFTLFSVLIKVLYSYYKKYNKIILISTEYKNPKILRSLPLMKRIKVCISTNPFGCFNLFGL